MSPVDINGLQPLLDDPQGQVCMCRMISIGQRCRRSSTRLTGAMRSISEVILIPRISPADAPALADVRTPATGVARSSFPFTTGMPLCCRRRSSATPAPYFPIFASSLPSSRDSGPFSSLTFAFVSSSFERSSRVSVVPAESRALDSS